MLCVIILLIKMSDNASKTRSKPGLLSKVPLSELVTLRVAVKRNITVKGPLSPIVRSIEDPKKLVPLVHSDRGQFKRSIFDRPDVEVNRPERFIIADANRLEADPSHSSDRSTKSRSLTPARNSNGPTTTRRDNNSRSRSREKQSRSKERKTRSKERSWSQERRSRSRERRSRNRGMRNNDKHERYNRNADSYSRTRGRSIDQGSRDRRSKGRSIERRDKRSEDRPAQRKSRSRDRSRDRSKDRYKPKDSESRGRNAVAPNRRSITPLRPGEYRPDRPYSRARSRSRDRSDRIGAVSRRSRSYSRDRREPSPSYRRSRSPRREKPSPRRSRSPGYSAKRKSDRAGEKRWSRSPTKQSDRNRSRSPHSSPNKHPRRSSRSPGRLRGRYRPPVDTRSSRSRSPHPPIVTFDRPTGKRRRSRSPEHDRRRRSRSPTRRGDEYGQQGPAHDFGYYEVPGAEFWIPGPIRPGFTAMPRFYPPAYFPRGFPPGTPIILPPRYPMMYPPTRPRFSYNRNRPLKPSTAIGGDSGAAKASSTVTTEAIVTEVVETEKNETENVEVEVNKGD